MLAQVRAARAARTEEATRAEPRGGRAERRAERTGAADRRTTTNASGRAVTSSKLVVDQ